MVHSFDNNNIYKNRDQAYELEPRFPRRSAQSGSTLAEGSGNRPTRFFYLLLHVSGWLMALVALILAALAFHNSQTNSQAIQTLNTWRTQMSERNFSHGNASDFWATHSFTNTFSHSTVQTVSATATSN
jgi:ABC-type glycerol-3-phosphate transport system permease component